ncbi:MAG: hypothetical protein AAF703_11980 [Cyanobacteria bacterium P01_D01_bin.105]
MQNPDAYSNEQDITQDSQMIDGDMSSDKPQSPPSIPPEWPDECAVICDMVQRQKYGSARKFVFANELALRKLVHIPGITYEKLAKYMTVCGYELKCTSLKRYMYDAVGEREDEAFFKAQQEGNGDMTSKPGKSSYFSSGDIGKKREKLSSDEGQDRTYTTRLSFDEL